MLQLVKIFQSTLPRGSDITMIIKITAKPFISIHAPSRERRRGTAWLRKFRRISIHAPSRERHAFLFSVPIRRNFNPRSLAGATINANSFQKARAISIHAPSRERQFTLHNYLTINLISIHAPSRERLIDTPVRRLLVGFQSTLPRGSDIGAESPYTTYRHFNPRSLAGATGR